MKFLNVRSIDCLFERMMQCEGAVWFTGSNGESIDIKGNVVIWELLKDACCKHGIEQLRVSVENSSDWDFLVAYMIGCGGKETCVEMKR